MNQQDIQKAVKAVVEGLQPQLFAANMDNELIEGVSTREAIRLAFQQLGVEVEFSGKGIHERGVVIDLDAEHMAEQDLNPDLLRFGQTVVRVTV